MMFQISSPTSKLAFILSMMLVRGVKRKGLEDRSWEKTLCLEPVSGSGMWGSIYAEHSSFAEMRQRVEFGKTQVVRTGREEDQRGGIYANKLLHNSEFGAEHQAVHTQSKNV